ncbi:LA_2272 family surface repeat-containing protein [Bdellovibrio bacteriovorus]|uniref:LA_2272 family surface repeat-containing protein n=1 Tax=Bdellovibrio TaxID=958 RepID=UPI0035A8EBF5
MMRLLALFLILIGASFSATSANAAASPIAIAIVPPIQFPPDDFSVTGLRVSALWGHHRNFYGLDLGLLGNVTDQDFTGLAVSGAFNYTRGTTHAIGLQVAGVANVNTSKTGVYGLQVASVLNYNSAASTVSGLQLALLANQSPFTDIYGAQVGIYNRAKDVYGLQIGVVNVADNLHGVQIGLVNFNHSGPFAVSPFLNVGF